METKYSQLQKVMVERLLWEAKLAAKLPSISVIEI